jgi:REP element-mobilizing transposase RayT
MKESPLHLAPEDRVAVDQAIREHCGFKEWPVVELNCRTNHVHIVVRASSVSADRAMTSLKAYATRALKKRMRRTLFWTEGGSTRRLYTDEAVCEAAQYVRDQ